MLIQIKTDRTLKHDNGLAQRVETVVRDAVKRYDRHVTRVVIHLTDENGETKAGPDDKHCRLEARVAGHQPIAVSHQAATVEQSVGGAAGKLSRSLERLFERWNEP